MIILLSLFKNYFIIIILYSIHYRYSTLILLLLFDFNIYKNRNSYFIKTFLLCARESYYYYSIFIIHSINLLSLFNIYFNYSTLILLSLFDFNFYKNLNLCFSHTFIMRLIVLLLLFDNYFIYLTFDV